ncbi:MAG: helix-turn-helix domain-containing protein [Pseudomonadota bacterium]
MSAVLGLADMVMVANRIVPDGAGGAGGLKTTIVDPARDLSSHLFDVVLFPPNLTGRRGEGDEQLHTWTKTQHQKGAAIWSACAGAFWLGHAGLLDGRPMTTHWALEEETQAAFPKALLETDQLIVDDNDIVTAGGVMAWVDLGLHLLHRWMGPDVVSYTCRQMLIDPGTRDQRSYRTFRPKLDHGDLPVRAAQLWIEAHFGENLTIETLARQAKLTSRTFQRRFARATGLAPGDYVKALRMEKARGLLERTTAPVSQIAWSVGYQDVAAFTRAFKATCGITTGTYRKRFAIL